MINRGLLTSTSRFGYTNPLTKNKSSNEVQVTVNGNSARHTEVISSKMITIQADISKDDDICVSYCVK